MCAKRNELTLKQKYDLVKKAEECPKMTSRDLAVVFKCGKTQVCSILKKKASIIESFEANSPLDIRRLSERKRSRSSPYCEVNDLLYEWYLMASKKNIHPDGPMLCTKAMEIAQRLGVSGFKASNGWVEKWKTRHNIKKMVVCGESGEVSGVTVQSWKERLPEMLQGYSENNIWNMDETGCFWKAMPDKGLWEKGVVCRGIKSSKVHLTIAFFVNAAGEKQIPVVIWKYEKPRCFKKIDKSQLPVQYFHQSNAWMTRDIMHEILSKLNHRMKAQGRSILLFMDNAGCHPNETCGK